MSAASRAREKARTEGKKGYDTIPQKFQHIPIHRLRQMAKNPCDNGMRVHPNADGPHNHDPRFHELQVKELEDKLIQYAPKSREKTSEIIKLNLPKDLTPEQAKGIILQRQEDLSKFGYILVDKDGNRVDPATVKL